jgi:hypothetical protein
MTTKPCKPGDPHHGVYTHVNQWHNTVECLPTWEELLEMEIVRQSGKINMMDGSLGRHLVDNGFFAAACWYIRCGEHRAHWTSFYSPALEHAQKEHGPRETWVTEEMREEAEERGLLMEESRLQEELRKIRKKREGRKV